MTTNDGGVAVALIGLGEVGTVLAQDIDVTVTAWDTGFADPASRASRNAERLGVPAAADPHAAVRDAELVISAVTAASTLAAAASVADALRGKWFLDLNSAAPGQKAAAARVVEAAGGRYVEAAVMSPITPKRLAAPMLLGGPHAERFAAFGASLGFSGLEPYADVVGPASATKLCRSVVVKGVEALVTESMLTARKWGVEGTVLASLSNLLPADDWEALAAYLISRSLVHGTRRAEEMREAVATVADAGVEPLMAEATARRQDIAGLLTDAVHDDLRPMLDALLSESDGQRRP